MGQDQKRGMAVGRETGKGVKWFSSAQTSPGQPGADAGCEVTGKTAAPGRPPSCGHCLTAHYMHLSAAQDWFLPPLNWEMSFRVKFLTQKFINLLQWLVTFFFFSSPQPPEQEYLWFVQLSLFVLRPNMLPAWVSLLCLRALSDVTLTPWAFCKAWSQEFISQEGSPHRLHIQEAKIRAWYLTDSCTLPFSFSWEDGATRIEMGCVW